jgi:hypothetical protein
VIELSFFYGTKKVDVFRPSPDDGKKPSFRKVIFYSYFEFLAMGEVHKPSDCAERLQMRTIA